jgi:hypothetical protein
MILIHVLVDQLIMLSGKQHISSFDMIAVPHLGVQLKSLFVMVRSMVEPPTGGYIYNITYYSHIIIYPIVDDFPSKTSISRYDFTMISH